MNIREVEGVVSKETDVVNKGNTTAAGSLAVFTFETLLLHGKHARKTCPRLTSQEYRYAEIFAASDNLKGTGFTDYLAGLAGVTPPEFTGGKLIRMFVAQTTLPLDGGKILINYQLDTPEQSPPVTTITELALHKDRPNVIATFSNCLVEGEGNIALASTAIAALREDATKFRKRVLAQPYKPS